MAGEYRTKSCFRDMLFCKEQETKRVRTLAGQMRGSEIGFQHASQMPNMVTCVPVTPTLEHRDRRTSGFAGYRLPSGAVRDPIGVIKWDT